MVLNPYLHLLHPCFLHLCQDTKTSEQTSEQQEYYNVTKDGVTMEKTQIYDNPDRLHNEIEMSPMVLVIRNL